MEVFLVIVILRDLLTTTVKHLVDSAVVVRM